MQNECKSSILYVQKIGIFLSTNGQMEEGKNRICKLYPTGIGMVQKLKIISELRYISAAKKSVSCRGKRLAPDNPGPAGRGRTLPVPQKN